MNEMVKGLTGAPIGAAALAKDAHAVEARIVAVLSDMVQDWGSRLTKSLGPHDWSLILNSCRLTSFTSSSPSRRTSSVPRWAFRSS